MKLIIEKEEKYGSIPAYWIKYSEKDNDVFTYISLHYSQEEAEKEFEKAIEYFSKNKHQITKTLIKSIEI